MPMACQAFGFTLGAIANCLHYLTLTILLGLQAYKTLIEVRGSEGPKRAMALNWASASSSNLPQLARDMTISAVSVHILCQ
jgi:hypothetical protein